MMFHISVGLYQTQDGLFPAVLFMHVCFWDLDWMQQFVQLISSTMTLIYFTFTDWNVFCAFVASMVNSK